MENKYNITVEQLLKIEEELDLFNKKIDGVYFWERIRFGVFNEILMKTGIIGQAHTKINPTFYNRTKGVFYSVKKIFNKNPFLAPKSDIMFFGHSRRKLGKDSKWHDIYCDPIIENLSQSYTYIESTYLGKHLSPAATRNIRYYDLVLLLASLLRKFKIIKIKYKEDEVALINKINSHIKQDFNIDINLHEKVSGSILSRKSQVPICRLLMKTIKPKIIIIVCSYGKENFIDAAKTLNIPIVELQHGFISSNHFGYSFPGPKRTKQSFPDYFLTFGELWNTAADFPIPDDRIISVGYPYIEQEVANYCKVEKKRQIVFISQGTFGCKLSKIALELSRRSELDYNIIYKLHPGEYARWKKEYPWLIDSTVKIVDNEEYPLYHIFAESQIQVGVNSTALFEGLAFNLHTFIIPFNSNTDSMQYLFSKGLASRVETVEDLMIAIGDLKEVSMMNIDYIFKHSAMENMQRVLNEILM